MFEQNNVGIRLESPVAAAYRDLQPHSVETKTFLSDLRLMVDHLQSSYLLPYLTLPYLLLNSRHLKAVAMRRTAGKTAMRRRVVNKRWKRRRCLWRRGRWRHLETLTWTRCGAS